MYKTLDLSSSPFWAGHDGGMTHDTPSFGEGLLAINGCCGERMLFSSDVTTEKLSTLSLVSKHSFMLISSNPYQTQ